MLDGAGSAGLAIARMLLNLNVKNIILCNRKGAIHKDAEGMNWAQEEMVPLTNKNNETGSLAEVLKGKDVFIGVSAPKMVTDRKSVV